MICSRNSNIFDTFLILDLNLDKKNYTFSKSVLKKQEISQQKKNEIIIIIPGKPPKQPENDTNTQPPHFYVCLTNNIQPATFTSLPNPPNSVQNNKLFTFYICFFFTFFSAFSSHLMRYARDLMVVK
jgi:hypothetical protein